jgi:hypothetical protein
MSPINQSDDENHPARPKGYRYSKDGKLLSPLEQLANVYDALCGDELFDEALRQGMSAEERQEFLERSRNLEDKMRQWAKTIEQEGTRRGKRKIE